MVKLEVKLLSLMLLAFSLIACSSAPKRPAEIFAVRNQTESQLALANKELDRGHPTRALELLAEAQRLAYSTDDPHRLIRVNLARGNALYYLDQRTEAQDCWNAALTEAEENGETELAAAARIFIARGKLLADGKQAAAVLDTVNQQLSAIKVDQTWIALGRTVVGMAEKELRNYEQAEDALKKALVIHTKGNYLEQAAYDWYLIASVRSVAGMYGEAVDALKAAIRYDRRAENSYGLAMDWRAMGDVRAKTGDKQGAAAAYKRSALIFDAIFMETESEASAKRGTSD